MDYSVSAMDNESHSFDYPSEWRPVAFPFEKSKVSQSCYNPHYDSSPKHNQKPMEPEIRLAQAQTQMLAEQFDLKIEELQRSSDEVWVFLSNFVVVAREFRLFIKSYRRGDAIAVEAIMASWLPIWLPYRCRWTRPCLEMHPYPHPNSESP